MLIGNRWLENTRMKILNADDVMSAGAWTRFTGSVSTNLQERGIIVGLSTFARANPGQEIFLNIEYDGQVMHEGFFRANICLNNPRDGNLQPAQMQMPALDVPSDVEVTISGRLDAGVDAPVNIDFYMVVYYLHDFEAATQTCFFPDRQPLPCP